MKPRRYRKRIRTGPVHITVAQALAWADDHVRSTGRWPTVRSGEIPDSGRLKWQAVDHALTRGWPGLRTRGTLAQFLRQHRGKKMNRTQIGPSVDQILKWADRFHQEHGKWPGKERLDIAAGKWSWSAINHMIFRHGCGVEGVKTLAQLLQFRRGARNPARLEGLTESKILRWAEDFCERTGRWPIKPDGPVTPGAHESWATVDSALRVGRRGLRGRSSLSQLLHRRRGVVYQPPERRSPLSDHVVLRWVHAHQKRTGKWPTCFSGRIIGVQGETWAGINGSMMNGRRGFRHGLSVARFLAIHGCKTYRASGGRLTKDQIIRWAKRHRRLKGQWPSQGSGAVIGAPREAWGNIQTALYRGVRGLPGGSSIAELLAPIRDRSKSSPQARSLQRRSASADRKQNRRRKKTPLAWDDRFVRGSMYGRG